ncbi:MAG: hypothetical protein IPK01_03835 [Acidobacteria bacterium]|nr:hypothetical protein [Acidobacteriota bacterium]
MASAISKKVLAHTLLIAASILVFAGLSATQTAAQSAASKEYKRLVNLQAALRKIPMDRQNKEPHRSFLKRNDKDIVYSEPAGEWYVRSDRFWDLQKKYKTLPIADQIAWTAAENQLPGECEGYIPCHLSVVRMTYGEYLSLYPNGKYSRKAFKRPSSHLDIWPMMRSRQRKTMMAIEAGDDAEFTKAIKDLRGIFSKTKYPETAKALAQLKQIEEGYK